MRVIIVRHGDPDYANDTLTAKGRREAKLLSKRLAKTKIDALYCSPLGRAKDTCAYTADEIGLTPVICPWLQEFSHAVQLPDIDRPHLIWDMLPNFWTQKDELYDARWLTQDFIQSSDVPRQYAAVCDSLDTLLKQHGYEREGRYYRAVKPNRDTIVLFCHFGAECILLSHLFHISPIALLHHFTALTTSVTTVFTEERRAGIASFRCAGFGDISHLYEADEEPSFSARFCETFDSDERHD